MQFNNGDYRSKRTRILYSESLLILNKNPKLVLSLISPLNNLINELSKPDQEQVIYLNSLANVRLINCIEGKKWLDLYLNRFHDGIYSKTSKDFLENSINNCK